MGREREIPSNKQSTNHNTSTPRTQNPKPKTNHSKLDIRHSTFLFLLSIFLTLSATAQPYAESIVDTLTSPYFAGRGYQDNVDGRTAQFLTKEFKQLGLQPLLEDYEQTFPLVVDVFPETPSLSINGQHLRLGVDFLPYASSASGEAKELDRFVRGESGLIIPDHDIFQYDVQQLKDAVLVMDETVPASFRQIKDLNQAWLVTSTRLDIAARFGAKAVIMLVENDLMYSHPPTNASLPVFMVQKEAWPDAPESLSYSVTAKQDWETTSSNVIAQIPGTSQPDKYLFVTAHYDHLGRIGEDFYFPGANDNASGVALTLELAKYFQQHPLNHTLVFIGFSGEERGLHGSRYFVENAPFPLEQIGFLINLDMVASGTRGIMALAGSNFPEEFALLSAVNDSLQLGPLNKRPNAPNSDHYFFLEKGVAGFFLYTDKGTQPYHSPADTPDTLEWDDFQAAFELVRAFLIALDTED